MKRFLTCVFILLGAICGMLGLAACESKEHEHTVVVDAAVPATCTESGLSEGKHCSVCHAVLEEQTVIPATGHVFDAWIKEPGTNMHYAICKVDNYRLTEECEYLKIVHEPTCSDPGYISYTCGVCLDSHRENEEPALGHKYSEDWICGENGKHYKICANDPSHRLEENCKDVKTVVAPKCEERGYTTHYCPDCGYTYDDDFQSALGHDYPKTWEALSDSKTHQHTCQREGCELVESELCNFKAQVILPTCEERGYTRYTCTGCSYSYDDVFINEIGHDWEEKFYSNEDGSHYQICKNDNTHRKEAKCEFSKTVKEATCESAGYTTYSCTLCSYRYTADQTEQLPHAWGAWIPDGNQTTHTRVCTNNNEHTETKECKVSGVITEPTCTAPGFTTFTCPDCHNEYRGAETAATDHIYKTSWTPTEGKERSHARVCDVCKYVDSQACSFNQGVVTEPTCTTPGFTTYTCNLCQFQYTDHPTPVTEHKLGAWKQLEDDQNHRRTCEFCTYFEDEPCSFTYTTKDPTCLEGGYTLRTCLTCGDEAKTDLKDPLEHDFSDPVYLKTAARSVNQHQYTCKRADCGYTKNEDCVMEDITNVPTCTAPADILKVCKFCMYTEDTGDLSALGHLWKDATEENPDGWTPVKEGNSYRHERTCTRCRTTEKGDCNFTPFITNATCTTGRVDSFTCATCNFSYTQTVGPEDGLGHDYTTWEHVKDSHTQHRSCQRPGCGDEQTIDCPYETTVIKPTCTDKGYTHHYCPNCQHTYDDSETTSIGHSYEETWTKGEGNTHYRVCKNDPQHIDTQPCKMTTSTVAAKCTEAGYELQRCSDCGKEWKTETEQPLGHSYPDAWTPGNNGQHSRICALCKEVVTDDCDYNSLKVEPTCETDGYTTMTCKVCSYEYTTDETDALGHLWSVSGMSTDRMYHPVVCLRNEEHTEMHSCSYNLEDHPATCEEGGYHIHTCSECHHSYRDGEKEKLGHDWGAYTFSKESDSHSRSCNRCNLMESDSCKYVAGEATPATCTKAGFTLITCSVCGGSYEDDAVAAKGHVWTDWKHCADSTDISEHSHTCSVCGETERKSCNLQYRSIDATCTTEGYTEVTCADCDRAMTKTNIIHELGHALSGWNYTGDGTTHTHQKTCSRCEYSLSGNCEMVSVSEAPTCTAPGINTNACKDCGHAERMEDTEALQHQWSEWFASNDGKHYKVCQRPNCNFTETEDCNYAVTVTPANCTDPQKTVQVCSNCQYTITTYGEEARGHLFGNWEKDENEHSAKCSNCETTVQGQHDFIESNLCVCGYDGLTYERPSVDGKEAAYYIVSNDGKVLQAKHIVIPELHEGLPVQYIGKYAFYRNESVETVVLPRSIIGIRENAFSICSKLESVTFEQSDSEFKIKNIEYGAFELCEKLKVMEIPNTLETIGNNAFSHCSALTDINLSDSVKDIGINSFYKSGIFNNAAKWTDGALYLNRHLISVREITNSEGKFTIRDDAISVSAYCFNGLTALKWLSIPDSVTIFDKDAFTGCVNLSHVEYAGTVAQWLAITFENDLASPMHYATELHIQNAKPNGKDGELILDEKVKAIPAGTFRAITGIRKVVIPESVVSIGSNAFRDCTDLEEVELKGTLSSLGDNVFLNTAFYKAEKNWKEGVLYLDDAKGGHYLLDAQDEKLPESGEVTILDNTIIICATAFENCKKLTAVTIPKEVIYIGEKAFAGCDNLASATFTGENVRFFAFNSQGAGRQYSNEAGNALADKTRAAWLLHSNCTGYWTKTLY